MKAITLHWGQRNDIRRWKLECGMAGGAPGSWEAEQQQCQGGLSLALDEQEISPE